MLDVAIISLLGLLVDASDNDPAPVQDAPVQARQDPYAHFSAALGDCLNFVGNGDTAVFAAHAEVNDAGTATGAFYPAMTGLQFQIAASQQGNTRTCGGAGPGAPTISALDEAPSLPGIFGPADLVEVAFPPPSRVWANCGAGDDTFVMMVPGANDFVVLTVNGPDPVAGTYCTAFGVK